MRQFEQIKMLLKLDKNLLNKYGKRHPKFQTNKNIYDNFVDFTKLPENLSHDAKSLLYRPQKMKVLYDAYRNICVQLKSNALRKVERQE
jgi:hypothetical protein